MKRPARCGQSLIIALALTLGFGAGLGRAAMHGGGGGHGGGFHGGRGGWHGGGFRGGHGHGPHVFIDGGFFFGAPFYWDYDPFFYGGPYYYPYPPAYAYPYYYPPPPPAEEPQAESSPPEEEQGGSEPQASGPAGRASYGLVQLRGIPEGASVDLDGRFWLTADQLDERWLALPVGTHAVTVRTSNAAPKTRRVDVRAGTTRVVAFSSGG